MSFRIVDAGLVVVLRGNIYPLKDERTLAELPAEKTSSGWIRQSRPLHLGTPADDALLATIAATLASTYYVLEVDPSLLAEQQTAARAFFSHAQ